MNKATLTINKSQQKNIKDFSYRSAQRRAELRRASRQYRHLAQQGRIPTALVDFFSYRPDKSSMRFMKLLMKFAIANGHFFAGIEWLAQELAICPESVSRMTRQLAALGIIKKIYRGTKRSVLIVLNPIFFKVAVRQRLSYIFPMLLFYSGQPLIAAYHLMSQGNVNYNIFKDLDVKKKEVEVVSKVTIVRVPGQRGTLSTPTSDLHIEKQVLRSMKLLHDIDQETNNGNGKDASALKEGQISPTFDYFDLLGVTTFGKKKMQMIPKNVRDVVAADLHRKKELKFDTLFEVCYEICKKNKIPLEFGWSELYQWCESEGIDRKKAAVVRSVASRMNKQRADQFILSQAERSRIIEEEQASGKWYETKDACMKKLDELFAHIIIDN